MLFVMVFRCARLRVSVITSYSIHYTKLYDPELTHMSHNIYAGYNKALGFLVAPGITGFWNYVTNFFESAGNFVRRIYSGNGQSYAVHVVTYTVVVFIIYLSTI